jgi:hypothetical protein
MHSNPPTRAAAGIGRSIDAASGPWFVMLIDGRVLGIAMHVLLPVATITKSFRRDHNRRPASWSTANPFIGS